nr:hypothetical protein [Tanacetum cinerariifolium]
MTSAEIDQIVAQRVTNAIESITVYEAIRMAHDSMNQVVRQGTTVEKNPRNKKKFENQLKDNRVPQQLPFKKPDVTRDYTIRSNEKKAYARNYLTTTSKSEPSKPDLEGKSSQELQCRQRQDQCLRKDLPISPSDLTQSS